MTNEVTLLREPSKVFIYELDETGAQRIHCIVKMLQQKHIHFIEERYQLRDDDGKVMRSDTGSPLIDWNNAAEHFYNELFVGCEETIRDDAGNIINTRIPDGKKTLAKILDAGLTAWVMKCARNRKAFYETQHEVEAGLPPGPGGDKG